jgi:hypothetical protein
MLIADSQKLRLDATSAVLAYELQRPKEAMPVLSMELRALTILLGRSVDLPKAKDAEAPPPAPLYLRTMGLARTLRAVAEYLRMSAQADQRDLASRMERGGLTSLTFAIETGLVDAIQQGYITEADIQSLILYARTGAGPAESQRRAVTVLNAVLRSEVVARRPTNPIASHFNLYDDFDFVIDRALLIRLQEFARSLLLSPAAPSPNVPDDPKGAVTQRIEKISDLAATIAALPVMAMSPLLDHTLEFLTHPWLRFTSKGRLADEISRIAEQHAIRRIAFPSGAPWPELHGMALLDSAVAGPWPERPREPTTTLAIAAPAWGRPLAADYSTKVAITEEQVTTVAALTWRLSETAATAVDIYRRTAGERSPNVPLTPVTVTRDMLTGEFSPLPDRSSNVLIAPSSMMRPRWHAVTDNWRLLQRPISRWHFYTQAYVVDDLKESPDVQVVPTVIERDEEPFAIAALKVILPFVKTFDAPGIPVSMTLQHLTDLWGITDEELHALLSQMSDGTQSFMARAFADRLRFIGVLTFELNGHKEVIPPMDGMWYHTKITKNFLVDDEKKILLGERTNVSTEGDRTAPVGRFYLHPFSHIPSSADVTAVAQHIKIVSVADERLHKPLAVWEVGTESRIVPVLPIEGWRLHPTPVADFIFNPTLPDPTAYVPTYVIPGGKNEYPLFSHAYNAVVSLMGPLSASPAGFPVQPAARYIADL